MTPGIGGIAGDPKTEVVGAHVGPLLHAERVAKVHAVEHERAASSPSSGKSL